MSFWQTFMLVELGLKYHIMGQRIGFITIFITVPYVVTAIIFPSLFGKCPKKLLIPTAFALTGISLDLIGPN